MLNLGAGHLEQMVCGIVTPGFHFPLRSGQVVLSGSPYSELYPHTQQRNEMFSQIHIADGSVSPQHTQTVDRWCDEGGGVEVIRLLSACSDGFLSHAARFPAEEPRLIIPPQNRLI